MGKRNKFGGYIEGVTEVHDQNFFEAYLKDKNWEKCDKWLQTEVCYIHNKVIRARIVYNVFGLIMSMVLAFFTWIMLLPDLTPSELEAFPLAHICNNIFLELCETVPYGKPAVIAGLLISPFIVCLIIWVVLLPLKSKRFAKRIKSKGDLGIMSEVKRKIEKLSHDFDKYTHGYYNMFFYALLGGVLTGGVMLFCSGGQNLFKYIILGAVFTVLYGLCLLGIASLNGKLLECFGVKEYPTYAWKETISWELGERPPLDEETPVEIINEEEEKRIII